MNDDYQIRLAQPADIPLLPEIERAAARLFAGLDLVQDLDDTRPIEELERAQRAGRLWVATTPNGRPVGFAMAIEVDCVAHLDELDVHPDHGRRGLGTALVITVCEWAKSAGFKAITLSTFTDVAWNAPFYARLGFRVLPEDELTDGLLRLREIEAGLGLPIGKRVMMRRELEEQELETIYHLVPESEFRAQIEGNTYLPARFAHHGFIHCTGDADTVLAVANDYFDDVEEPVLVLVIETAKVKAEVRLEPPVPVGGSGRSHLEHNQLFPHIYGCLNLDAVVEIGVLQRDAKGYRWPDRFSKGEEFAWTA